MTSYVTSWFPTKCTKPSNPSKSNGTTTIKIPPNKSLTPQSKPKSSKIKSNNYKNNSKTPSVSQKKPNPLTINSSKKETSTKCTTNEYKKTKRSSMKTSKNSTPSKISTTKSMTNWSKSTTLPWNKKCSSRSKETNSKYKPRAKKNPLIYRQSIPRKATWMKPGQNTRHFPRRKIWWILTW